MKKFEKKLKLGWAEKWGNKETTIFWAPYKNQFLDYSKAEDREQIHRECGGKLVYKSFSGKTGCGYLLKMGALVPVGYYNPKTGVLHSQEVDTGVKVMIPYDNMAVDAGYPFVIVKYDKVVYCNQKNFHKILKDILRGDWANEPTKVYKKTLYSSAVMSLQLVELNNYFFGTSKRMPSPWQFAEDLLKPYMVERQSYLESKLKVARVGNQIVKTEKLGTFICAKEPIQSDPLVSDDELMEILKNSSWEVGVGPCDCIYKLGDKEVEVIVWSKPQLWYKKVSRKAETLPKEKKDVFVKEAQKKITTNVYANYVFNKTLFLLDIDRCQGVTRKLMIERVDEILDEILDSIIE